MLRKSKIIEAGNYREYYLCEDYDMWIRMIEKKARCYNIQDILVYMRVSKDFYKRRGGIKYLKYILKFKREHLVCVNERKLRALSCGKKQCSAMSTQADRERQMIVCQDN